MVVKALCAVIVKRKVVIVKSKVVVAKSKVVMAKSKVAIAKSKVVIRVRPFILTYMGTTLSRKVSMN